MSKFSLNDCLLEAETFLSASGCDTARIEVTKTAVSFTSKDNKNGLIYKAISKDEKIASEDEFIFGVPSLSKIKNALTVVGAIHTGGPTGEGPDKTQYVASDKNGSTVRVPLLVGKSILPNEVVSFTTLEAFKVSAKVIATAEAAEKFVEKPNIKFSVSASKKLIATIYNSTDENENTEVVFSGSVEKFSGEYKYKGTTLINVIKRTVVINPDKKKDAKVAEYPNTTIEFGDDYTIKVCWNGPLMNHTLYIPTAK